MQAERFVEDLLRLLPYWHYKVDRPFKQSIKQRMTLETYYSLQMLRHGGPVTMGQLSAKLGMSKQQATKLVDRLSQSGFVERVADPADRRAVRIRATERAEAYLEATYHQDRAFYDALRERVGEADLERMHGAIQTLLEILQRMP
ncbi:MAG: MarR family winged helix-turn-helix transcriptional regulator [Christensenellales bacterium]|jgi:DNA-binding MarR family transcriptional regulator